ncbi:MAG TPA: class I SAM-dependent methyltransferase [Pirellulales bacterium]|nr:class I SAM-dependent methyltransferase [Pirellulales bacterium]
MKSTERFTDRVDDYVKYRPHYPQAVFDTLREKIGDPNGSAIADIGSGTGISTKPLVEMGFEVFAVEPNAAMREAAERELTRFRRFHSVAATAENTLLADGSVDAVLAAQAFHWFDRPVVHKEFGRILKPGGWVALVWNDRDASRTSLARDYEQLLLTFGSDYGQVKSSGQGANQRGWLNGFFGRQRYEEITFKNHQLLDFDAFRGRLLSASYMPKPADCGHSRMLDEIERIFARHQSAEHVRIDYETKLFLGHL